MSWFKRSSHIIWPCVSLGLFAVALIFLYGELRQYDFDHLYQDITEFPAEQIWLSAVFCIASYIVLTFYDALALLYVKHYLPYWKIALASYLGYTFSHNLGFALFTGGAIRFRLLSRWGLGPGKIANVITFSSVTYWLGCFVLGGLVLIIEPFSVPSIPFAENGVRILGVFFLSLGIAYIALTVVRRKPFRIFDWEIPLPSWRLALTEVLLASVDWSLAGLVFYVLLPQGIQPSFPYFMGIFFLGQTIGFASHVPGGLGVFETIVLLLLPPGTPSEALVPALVLYRIIYFLIPFSFSAVLLLTYEVMTQHKRIKEKKSKR